MAWVEQRGQQFRVYERVAGRRTFEPFATREGAVDYEFSDGEYGGSSTTVTLDDVTPEADSYFGRTLGRDIVSDLCQELLCTVWEAERVAREAAIAALVGTAHPGHVLASSGAGHLFTA